MKSEKLLPFLGKSLFGMIATLILAGLVLPRFPSGGADERLAGAKGDLIAFQAAIDAYKGDLGRYPRSLQDLCEASQGKGPWLLMKEIPPDPYGHPYRVAVPVLSVWSLGPDGLEGTEDDIYPPGSPSMR